MLVSLKISTKFCAAGLASGRRDTETKTPGANTERLQVKARVITDPKERGERQLSFFRSWDFEAAIIVLFRDDFTVWRAARLPVEVVREVARHVGHVSGWRVIATDELLARGEDWTERLRQAAQ